MRKPRWLRGPHVEVIRSERGGSSPVPPNDNGDGGDDEADEHHQKADGLTGHDVECVEAGVHCRVVQDPWRERYCRVDSTRVQPVESRGQQELPEQQHADRRKDFVKRFSSVRLFDLLVSVLHSAEADCRHTSSQSRHSVLHLGVSNSWIGLINYSINMLKSQYLVSPNHQKSPP